MRVAILDDCFDTLRTLRLRDFDALVLIRERTEVLARHARPQAT